MRRFLMIAWVMVATMATMVACYKDNIELPAEESVPEGYMALSIPVTMSDEAVVETRSVDPDGMDIHSISLFCFDKFGLFISYIKDVKIEIDPSVQNIGKILKALVPENTRRLHFVANQNLATFSDSDHRGMHEEQVMTELVSSSGMMIYWARYTDDNAESATAFKNNLTSAHGNDEAPIKMLRNQAKVTVISENDAKFEVEGFVVVNSQAFGTVAPRHPELGFDFEVESDDWTDTDFVTLPSASDKMVKLSPPADVDNAPETYIFESENTSDDPVSVIIKGKANGSDKSLYYRALVLKEEQYKMIRRNHHYQFKIVGALSYGEETFEEALVGSPTNNIWLSIDDEVNEVRNNQYILGVEKTSVVVLAVPRKDANGNIVKVDDKTQYEYPKELVLNYNFSTDSGGHVAEAPEVQWLENGVARDWMRHNYTNGTNHSITIELSDISTTTDDVQKNEGTILIRKGLLQRKIKIIVLKQQSFVPMWVTTQIYGGDTDTVKDGFQGANVTMLFTVPEQTPDELLPFEVYISVDHLDVQPESGEPLPVIRSDDPRYGSDVRKHPHADASSDEAKEMIGYKYVYTVTEKGDQRVYFKNILDQTNKTYGDHNHEDYITIESPYFATLSKPFVFSKNNHQRAITITNLNTYNVTSGDPVYYMLVPAKKGAHAVFNIQLKDGDTPMEGKYKDPNGTNTFDEFLLYSEYLDHEEHDLDATNCYAHFTSAIEAGTYGTHTRTFGMHFTKTPNQDHIYPIQMHTNRAKSAEVVRLASNQAGSPSAFPDKENGATYAGDGDANYTYRSVIFELANYRPFRFMASVKGEGLADEDDTDGIDAVDHDAAQTQKDGVSNLQLTYEPSQEIDVAFDITEFVAQVDNTDHHVDPFGRAFRVFIDAPMLDIDQTKADNLCLTSATVTMPDGTTSKKFYKDTDGRFVYVVDANRSTEATFWGEDAEYQAKSTRATAGERKVLPFKTKSTKIVTAGEIRISADAEEVIYDEKVFHVTNTPITGTITYGEDGGNQTSVPAGAFISFAVDSDNSRIGSITVKENGQYELRLRPEYQIKWEDQPINITYTVETTIDGNTTYTYYSYQVADLEALFESPSIQLVNSSQSGE